MISLLLLFKQLLDTEDLAESENKELASRLESLESIVRMLELKHKNSLEHASRLEEREGDLKKVRKLTKPIYLKIIFGESKTKIITVIKKKLIK